MATSRDESAAKTSKSSNRSRSGSIKASAPKNQNSKPSLKEGRRLQQLNISKETGLKLLKVLAWVVVVLSVFVVLDLLVQYLNNGYSAAVVNGTRISRTAFIERLEESYGTSVIQGLISEELIRQEAAEREINVSDSEIDELLQQTKNELGGDEAFQSALEANGLSEDRYRKDIELRLLAEKMVVEEPTEEQLKDFFKQYKSAYYEEDTAYEDVKDDVRTQYFSQKFNELSADWLANLRTEANIQDNITEPPSYGFLRITGKLGGDIYNRISEKR